MREAQGSRAVLRTHQWQAGYVTISLEYRPAASGVSVFVGKAVAAG